MFPACRTASSLNDLGLTVTLSESTWCIRLMYHMISLTNANSHEWSLWAAGFRPTASCFSFLAAVQDVFPASLLLPPAEVAIQKPDAFLCLHVLFGFIYLLFCLRLLLLVNVSSSSALHSGYSRTQFSWPSIFVAQSRRISKSHLVVVSC